MPWIVVVLDLQGHQLYLRENGRVDGTEPILEFDISSVAEARAEQLRYGLGDPARVMVIEKS